MSHLKSKVGMKSDSFRELVTNERISLFSAAVDGQKEKGAPPTFMTVFRRGEFTLFEKLGLQLSRALHAEQEYEFGAPILPGDEIQYQTEVTHVMEKQGSNYKMQFVTLETTFVAERISVSHQVGKAKSTVIFREIESGKGQ